MREITITAHVVVDAEIKSSKVDGQPYLSMKVANNEFKEKNDKGENVYDTTYYLVTSFNKRHLKMANYYKKGSSLIIVGDYSDSIYTSATSGKTLINRNIIASEIYFNSTDRKDTRNGAAQAAQSSVQNTTQPATIETVKVTTPIIPTVNTAQVMNDDDLPF